jgi:hypothetical protein
VRETEKGKPIEKEGRKAEDLRQVIYLLWWPGYLEYDSILGVRILVNTNRVVESLDLEWLALIFEAKELGISKETVTNFLNQNETPELSMENR